MFENYNTVAEVQDGEIVVVGERHGDERSADLVSRVTDKYDFDAVGVEALIGDGGMGAAIDFAEGSMPIAVIDRRPSFETAEGDDRSELIEEANTFSKDLDENGDISWDAIADARKRVREKFKFETYCSMYPERETAMAERINWLNERHDGKILVVVGTFHIMALEKLLRLVDDETEPDRMLDFKLKE